MERKPVTPARFTHLAEQIAGPRWRTRLPARIGRCRSQVWEYAAGKRPVPGPVARLMELLAEGSRP